MTNQTKLFELPVKGKEPIKSMNFDRYNQMIKQMQSDKPSPMNEGIKILTFMVENGLNPLKPIK